MALRLPKKNVALGLVVAVLIGLFVMTVLRSQTPTIASRVEQDRQRDVARFTPANSLDISMAMGLTSYDSPRMLNPPGKQAPQLLFPPSTTDLEKLCGV